MNWKLILSLSLFGLLMGIASTLGLTRGLEPILWSLIGIFCAVWIGRKGRGRYFSHGFLTGLLGGGLAPLLQVIFFSTYLAINPASVADLSRLPPNFSARKLFLLMVPVIAVLSGLLLGLMSWVAGRIISRHRRLSVNLP